MASVGQGEMTSASPGGTSAVATRSVSPCRKVTSPALSSSASEGRRPAPSTALTTVDLPALVVPKNPRDTGRGAVTRTRERPMAENTAPIQSSASAWAGRASSTRAPRPATRRAAVTAAESASRAGFTGGAPTRGGAEKARGQVRPRRVSKAVGVRRRTSTFGPAHAARRDSRGGCGDGERTRPGRA